MTDLSIITVSYKGWERLTKSLEALNAFTGRKIKIEVIIVDNRSEDDTILSLATRFPSFRFVHNKVNGGFANGCNLGALNSSGEYLLFLNPDTLATEYALEKLLDIARSNPDISILSCRQVNEKGKESSASGKFPELWNLTGFLRAVSKSVKVLFSLLTPHPAPHLPHPAPPADGRTPGRTTDIVQSGAPLLIFPGWVSGSVILIRKEQFRGINGFDEDYWMYYEDVDLCKRLTDRGGKIAFTGDVSIEHNHGGSSRANIRTASLTKTEVHISRHIYISKHKKGPEKFMIQLFLVINNLFSAAIMALAGLLLFFVPGVFSRTLIFGRLVRYYAGALIKRSWIGSRSVNFKNVKND